MWQASLLAGFRFIGQACQWSYDRVLCTCVVIPCRQVVWLLESFWPALHSGSAVGAGAGAGVVCGTSITHGATFSAQSFFASTMGSPQHSALPPSFSPHLSPPHWPQVDGQHTRAPNGQCDLPAAYTRCQLHKMPVENN